MKPASLVPCAWLLASLASTAAYAQEPPPADSATTQARARFEQGVRLAASGNCAGAIVEFQASYELSARPNTLYNIAQCQERVFRYDLAIGAYERYLREAAPGEQDRAAVEAAVRTLHNLLGTIRIRSNVAAEVWIGDHLMGQAPGDVWVPGGNLTVELRAERYLPARQEVRVASRETVAATFTLRRAERRVTIREESGIDPWLFWTGVAGTAVTAGIGTYFGVHALTLSSDARAAHDAEPRLSQEARAQDIDQAALVADIFFASAGVLAIGTTIVFFVTRWGDAQPQVSAEPDHALRLVPTVGPTVSGLSLAGTF